jgi:hypothetical protein
MSLQASSGSSQLPSNAALVSWGEVFAYSFDPHTLETHVIAEDEEPDHVGSRSPGQSPQTQPSFTSTLMLNEVCLEQAVKLTCSGTSLLAPTYGQTSLKIRNLWTPINTSILGGRDYGGDASHSSGDNDNNHSVDRFPVQAHAIVLSGDGSNSNSIESEPVTSSNLNTKPSKQSKFSFGKLFSAFGGSAAGSNEQNDSYYPVTLQLLSMNMIGTEAEISKAKVELAERAKNMIADMQKVGAQMWLWWK